MFQCTRLSMPPISTVVLGLLSLLSPLAFAASGFAAEPATPIPKPAEIRLTPGAPAASPDLVAFLAAKDLLLFEAVFDCRLELLTSLVADDFEFFHDKGGKTANSGPEFVAAVTQGCEHQKTGVNFKARRELVEGTMTVHVLQNYGAMQMGTHRFFALQAGQPDRLTETGKFIDLWKQEGDTWKLARVISYDHQLAQ